jgi:Fe-S cluster assembly iron-binding protein IscA
MSFAHLLTNNQQTSNPSNMTPANTQDEEAHIRNTLEINSFDLATLENYLISNAYIPASSDDDAIKKAMYRLYERYLDEAPHFARNPRLADLFNPYPYGDVPVDDALGNTSTAREAHKHKRESAKYDAVKDLIRIIATRKIQTAEHAEEAPEAEQSKGSTAAKELKLEREKSDLLEKQLENLHVTLAVEHGKTSTAENELKLEKEKTHLLEKQVKSLQTKYEAVKVLVDESFDSELERIDNANNIRDPRRPSGFRAREKAATGAVKEETPRTPPPASTRRPAIYLPDDGRQAATATASEIAQDEEEKKRAAEEEEARVLRNHGRRQRPLPNPKSEPVVDTPETISPVEILGEPAGSLLDEHEGTIPEGIQKSRRRIRGRRKRSGKGTAAASATEESSETVAATPAPLL